MALTILQPPFSTGGAITGSLTVSVSSYTTGSMSFVSVDGGSPGITTTTGALVLRGASNTLCGYALFDTSSGNMSIGQFMMLYSSSFAAATGDLGHKRNAAGVLEINTGTAGTYAATIAAEHRIAPTSTNGQSTNIKCLTELTTIGTGLTTDTTIQLPSGAIILSVSVRVTTVIPTAATFEVGDSGSASRFNTASVAVASGSTDVGTKAGAYYNATATAVRLTMTGMPVTNTGRVRVTITYLNVTVPTS